ncbi:hypothetical protein Dimus_030163 [Dionaea muscipula]
MIKALPIDVIWKKRVIRSKIIREGWMNDNGLNNVMELIKRQRWENLFKRRELVHIDAVKEFYAKMTVIHLKKKDVVKSKVRGVEVEFDHEKLATILGIPGNNEICEYVKDVWEESKYIKPLEITRRFVNNETLTAARRVEEKTEEGMMILMFQVEEEVEKEEENQTGFDWEAVIDEATIEGNRVGEKFYDAEDENPGSPEEQEEIPRQNSTRFSSSSENEVLQSRPSGPTAQKPIF